MSLHIQSPETEAELRRQRRMATTMSMVIAVLSVALIGLILAFIILPSLSQKSATLVTYQAAMPEDVRLDQKRMDTQVQRKPSAPSSAMAKVIASTSPAPISVPVPEVTENPSLEFGSDGDFGSGWGSGDGTGAGGTRAISSWPPTGARPRRWPSSFDIPRASSASAWRGSEWTSSSCHPWW